MKKVGIILVTYNGLGYLKQGIPSLLKTKYPDFHLYIFDNGSTDGTTTYLRRLKDKRISLIKNGDNVGMNGYPIVATAVSRKCDYMVTIDQDVIHFPDGWLMHLLNAFQSYPGMGYLATNVVQNNFTNGCIWSDYTFEEQEHAGYTYMFGNKYYLTGGWCTMTSSKIYQEVQGFRYERDEQFFQIDGPYCDALNHHGYKWAILKDVKVLHACGPYCARKYGEWNEKIRGISYEDAIKQYSKRDKRLTFR